MERFTSTITLLLFSLIASAQLQFVQIDTLPFAHYSVDTLYLSSDSNNLFSFFQKFDSVVTTHQGNINILQIGGSHIQAGTLPHRIRKNILSAYPELSASRGFIFPYSAAKKCNNPSDYKVCKSNYFSLIRNVYKNIEKPLGASGIAIYTKDSLANITIKLNEPDIPFYTNQIVLLGFSDSGSVVPKILKDSIYYLPSSIDSTLRRYVYDIPVISDSFTIVFPCDTFGMFTLTGIFLLNQSPGITYHSIGVNGADVPAYLNCTYFTKDLQLVKPDLVIFNIGINDAAAPHFDTLKFKNNYLQLIDSIKLVNPDCAFIFVTNNDSYKRISRGKYSVNHNGPLARDVFYRLANQTNSALWDQFDVMGGLKSMDKWRIAKYANYDRVHFLVKGYQLIGDLFFNAFVDAYNKWKTINS